MNKPTRTLVPLVVLLASGCWLPEPRTVATQEETLAVDGLDTLRFDVGAGDLDVVGDPALDHVEVTVVLRTNRAMDDHDADALRALDFRLEAIDGEASLVVRLDDSSVSDFYADVTVALPSSMHLAGQDGSGDIHVRDVASLDLVDDSGDIWVSTVPGAVLIDDASGDLQLRSTGEVAIHDTSGEIDVAQVDGGVVIEDDSGEITVEDVSLDVDIVDESGGIRVRHVVGTVTITDGSGDIDVSDVGRFDLLADGSGDVSYQ
ncbi:MAG: DUF4097 family beta strand repeat protein [Sandaracinaceae bacterium]|nr:DUF4097 family beta strand repeat protein [Sandaracinaceae bacterium]